MSQLGRKPWSLVGRSIAINNKSGETLKEGEQEKTTENKICKQTLLAFYFLLVFLFAL